MLVRQSFGPDFRAHVPGHLSEREILNTMTMTMPMTMPTPAGLVSACNNIGIAWDPSSPSSHFFLTLALTPADRPSVSSLHEQLGVVYQ